MIDKIKELIAQMNTMGVPLPTVRDPKTGKGSISVTLVVISSIYVQVGLIGKYSKLLDGIDMTSALGWFLMSMGLYYFNKRISVSKDKIELESSNEQPSNEEKDK